MYVWPSSYSYTTCMAIHACMYYKYTCTGRAKLVHVYMSADIYCNLPFFFLIYLKKNNKKIQKNKKTVKISNLMRNRTHDHWNSSDVRVHVYHTCTRAMYQRQVKKLSATGSTAVNLQKIHLSWKRSAWSLQETPQAFAHKATSQKTCK